MKKKVKYLSLLLCLFLLVTLFASCDTGGDAATATPSSNASQTPAAGDNGNDKQDNVAVAEGGIYKLPLVDTVEEFSIWHYLDVSGSNMTDLNENQAYIEAEKRTGIHINWKIPPAANIAESLQLSIASNDYEDAYYMPRAYLTQGSDYYVDNDIFMDLEPHIALYAPNYNYVRTSNNLVKDTLTDSGYAIGIWQIAQSKQWSWMGPLGRTDWLKELNMELPKTYDQLHDVLVAFRDNFNPEAPLSIGVNGLESWLMVGFDTKVDLMFQQYFIQINGKVKYGALEPGFKEYVQTMADWYAEGLVDPEFYARDTSFGASNAPIMDGNYGIVRSLYTNPDFYERTVKATEGEDSKFEYRGFYLPVKNEGDTRKIGQGGAELNLMKDIVNVISTQCENFETLMRWIDYYYTDDGALLASYGIENESYYIDEAGKPQIEEIIYNNPDGLSLNRALYRYAMTPAQAMWYDWEREVAPGTSQNVWDTREYFDGNWVDEYSISPFITMTTEESTEYSNIMTDINTLIEENVVKFISGQTPMTEFDSFIAQIQSMNIDRATAIQQAAFDRYANRGA